MNALQINGNTALQAQPIIADKYLVSFLNFIDRPNLENPNKYSKTEQTYLTNLKQFAAWLSEQGITQPVRDNIIAYRDYLITKCKPNTVAQYLRTVCQFFRWAASEGLYDNIADNIHAPKVRHDAHKKEALQANDVLNIENSIQAAATEKASQAADNAKDTAGRIERATEQGKRLYAMYLLAVNAGLRTIEIERANVKDLVVKNGNAVLYVWGKGHSEADSKKPLAPEVYAAIKDYLKSRTDGAKANSPLFVATGNRSGGKRIAARTISQMLKQAMREAGYDSERLTAHSLRHTAGTNVMELSGNIYTTQKYMRHANPSTTEIYLHNDTEKQETQVAQQLYNHYHGHQDSDNSRSRLEQLVNTMNQEQLTQLLGVAAAIAK